MRFLKLFSEHEHFGKCQRFPVPLFQFLIYDNDALERSHFGFHLQDFSELEGVRNDDDLDFGIVEGRGMS